MNQLLKILFFHGLESEGLKPEKRKALEEILKKEMGLDVEIFADRYDYRNSNYNFEFFKEQVRQIQPDLLMGSSFGGRIAFHLSNIYIIPSVLFNPAVNSKLCSDILRIEKQWDLIYPNQYYIIGAEDTSVPPVESFAYLIENGLSGELKGINLVAGMEHRVEVKPFAQYAYKGIRKVLKD